MHLSIHQPGGVIFPKIWAYLPFRTEMSQSNPRCFLGVKGIIIHYRTWKNNGVL